MIGQFRSNVWDPFLIISQMIAMQFVFYSSVILWITILDLLTGSPKSLDQIFRYSSLYAKDLGGRKIIVVFLTNALVCAGGLWFIVQRAKQCLDFTATVHFFHFLLSWLYNGALPRQISWWLLQGVCITVTTVLEWRKTAQMLLQNYFGDEIFLPSVDFVKRRYFMKFKNMDAKEFNELRVMLGRVAFNLRLYKMFAENPRDEKIGSFYQNFPIPPIRRLHREVASACGQHDPSTKKELDFVVCIKELHTVFMLSYWHQEQFFGRNWSFHLMPQYGQEQWRHITVADFHIHLEPFANSADRFEYVMTTAYYLCWFSMLELPVLAHLPYCELTDKWHMTFNSDRDRNKRESIVDVMDPVPFRCARFSFCPDPCCGRTRMKSDGDCLRGGSNICAGLRDTNCYLPPEQNENFGAIINNRFNITCNCGLPGLKFSSAFGKCLDKDECQTGEYQCETTATACMNTVGSYKCICGIGQRMNERGECVLIQRGNFEWYMPQYQASLKVETNFMTVLMFLVFFATIC